MRESPSCVVALRRFGVWRAALAAVTVAAVTTVAAWGASAFATASDGSTAIVAIAGALALGSVLLATSLWRVDHGVLACRDGRWTFTPDHAATRSEESGEVEVAIDLGSFMLLTLRRAGVRGPAARRWLPVQRRGLESDWHALRCAVYSPPLAAPELSAAGEPPH